MRARISTALPVIALFPSWSIGPRYLDSRRSKNLLSTAVSGLRSTLRDVVMWDSFPDWQASCLLCVIAVGGVASPSLLERERRKWAKLGGMDRIRAVSWDSPWPPWVGFMLVTVGRQREGAGKGKLPELYLAPCVGRVQFGVDSLDVVVTLGKGFAHAFSTDLHGAAALIGRCS